MYIVLDQNVNGCWFWKMCSDNGQILSISESYSSKTKCMKTAKSVAKALATAQGVDISKILRVGTKVAPKTSRAR